MISNSYRKPRILIADGSMFERTLLRAHLESFNFDVVAITKDYKECLNQCLGLKPDVVLVDISIAEADDFALIQSMREVACSSDIIVMIPELARFPNLVVEAVKAGAASYISKPVSPVDLRSRMEDVLRKQKGDGS